MQPKGCDALIQRTTRLLVHPAGAVLRPSPSSMLPLQLPSPATTVELLYGLVYELLLKPARPLLPCTPRCPPK